METRMDKLQGDARFEANPPKAAPIADATALWIALGRVYLDGEDGGEFENMPRCTVKALYELLQDDDANEDTQFRAERRLSANAMEALAQALLFARIRLSGGTETDRACARGIDKLLNDAGVVLPARFPNVGCSHCGGSFGPGDHGFSHCENHAHLARRD